MLVTSHIVPHKLSNCPTFCLFGGGHPSLYPPAPAHQVLSRATLCCVGSHDSAGLYSEGACYNVMIKALDSEHNLFFYNKLCPGSGIALVLYLI